MPKSHYIYNIQQNFKWTLSLLLPRLHVAWKVLLFTLNSQIPRNNTPQNTSPCWSILSPFFPSPNLFLSWRNFLLCPFLNQANLGHVCVWPRTITRCPNSAQSPQGDLAKATWQKGRERIRGFSDISYILHCGHHIFPFLIPDLTTLDGLEHGKDFCSIPSSGIGSESKGHH